jgi:hypothetical protein
MGFAALKVDMIPALIFEENGDNATISGRSFKINFSKMQVLLLSLNISIPKFSSRVNYNSSTV